MLYIPLIADFTSWRHGVKYEDTLSPSPAPSPGGCAAQHTAPGDSFVLKSPFPSRIPATVGLELLHPWQSASRAQDLFRPRKNGDPNKGRRGHWSPASPPSMPGPAFLPPAPVRPALSGRIEAPQWRPSTRRKGNIMTEPDNHCCPACGCAKPVELKQQTAYHVSFIAPAGIFRDIIIAETPQAALDQARVKATIPTLKAEDFDPTAESFCVQRLSSNTPPVRTMHRPSGSILIASPSSMPMKSSANWKTCSMPWTTWPRAAATSTNALAMSSQSQLLSRAY